MLITVARARIARTQYTVIGSEVMITSDDSVAGKPFWEKNKLLPCWIVERFLVGNAYKTDTY